MSLGYGIPGALLTAVVLILGATLTWLAWRATRDAEQARADGALAVAASDVEAAIEDRLLAYEGLLRAGAGVANGFWPLTAPQWKAFTAELRLAAVYPGIQGIGFAASIDGPEAFAYWKHALGPNDLSMRAAPEATLPQSAIVFLEPLDERNRRALGFDMMSEPTRRVAMERARDAGVPALSGKVVLLQDSRLGNGSAGFLLYLPVYTTPIAPSTLEARRAALRGFVYSPFRAEDFFASALLSVRRGTKVEVFDGSAAQPETLLFDNHVQAGGERRDTRHITLAGHTWTVRLSAAGTSLGAAAQSPAMLIALGGAAMTALLAAIVMTLLLSRQRLRERMHADSILAQLELEAAQVLELRVAERTAQLEVANRELSSANHDLEAFTYSVSHDLRAPLRAIDGHVQRLFASDESLNQEQRRHVSAVRRNIARMDQLIEDLLRFAFIGRRPLEKRPVVLWGLVRSILQELQTPKHVVYEINPDELGTVAADPALLRQALTNLLSNAVKFSREVPTPHIAIGSREDAAGRVYFVRDNGVGFDMQYADKLFGVFERLHSSHEFEGSGVGLAIVRQILERHGGRVWAESRPGAGATFYFTLPA